MTWHHDQLANDLASHLLDARRRMVWTNLQLGPAGSPRPDVYTLDRSFMRPNPRAFEVKVSVSDFRSDVTAGKWQNYLKFSQSVTFAVPHGLVNRADIPPGCGFMVRSERGWATIRKPTLSTLNRIPEDALLKLLIDGCDRERRAYRTRQFDECRAIEKNREKLGKRVAEAVYEMEAVERRIEGSKETAKRVIERAEKEAADLRRDATREARALLADVCAAFELKVDDDDFRWGLRHAIERRIRQLDANKELQRLKLALRQAKRSLEAVEECFGAEEAA